MARKINRLNARAVATITKHGRHADGGGLYLSISPNGGRRWVFLYRWHGKPTEIGFGSARDVTLARARELASQARAKLAESINPKDARKPSGGATFGQCADRQARCAMGNDIAGLCGSAPPSAGGQDHHR
jgi:Arm DNA-binding domain